VTDLGRQIGERLAERAAEADIAARAAVLAAVADLPRADAATLLYRLAYELRTGRTPAALLPPKLSLPPREPAPCPSEAAYRRHLKDGEPVDRACREHMRRLSAEWTRRQRRAGSRA
jgi:hypothetical protein